MSEDLETVHGAIRMQLERIAQEIRENDGKLSSPRMLDDAKDCLQALKDLRKLSSFPTK